MKQNEITKLPELEVSNYANIFNVYKDKDGNYFYNINKAIYINGQENMIQAYYQIYEIEHKDTWPLIAHKVYEDYSLWWILCKVNNISNPLEMPEVGTDIIVLEESVVESILMQLESL